MLTTQRPIPKNTHTQLLSVVRRRLRTAVGEGGVLWVPSRLCLCLFELCLFSVIAAARWTWNNVNAAYVVLQCVCAYDAHHAVDRHCVVHDGAQSVPHARTGVKQCFYAIVTYAVALLS